MHELSICESIVQTLASQAKVHEFSRVSVLRLEIGQFAGVELEALKFCFPVVAMGTLAEDARLEITTINGTGWCEQCQCSVNMEERFSPCPDCGVTGLPLSQGDEMRIANVEVE
ncbi:hydrogenase maturation nickel metallochaperone HypA [Enterovibrio paralichthyis]|uniref:hydrogenase maturation nickel metallochaperone HypA n=1 Tax=Enterovibrio paralichthyis TaxID=2853805 RepID=UPI001C44B1E8|nr:hydrogenase maturation nickel metallochaperone HypA [Enterovibrio paralichthyis]MBV7296799.1 hydrogenase maturation nickel metallochaperone HypA [Enterovibrio paralichthyis]